MHIPIYLVIVLLWLAPNAVMALWAFLWRRR